MERNKISEGLSYRAQMFSDIFSPMLVPTYGLAVALWITPLSDLPSQSRLTITLFIAVITGLLPFLAILALRKTRLVDDMAVTKRSQRPVPMVIAMLCYIGAALFLSSCHYPLWLQMFFYGAAVATALATLITLKWKISAHTTAVGGFAGMLMWFAICSKGHPGYMVMMSGGLLISGGVASCRMLLRRHTLAQVIAGFFLGFASTFGLLFYFYS